MEPLLPPPTWCQRVVAYNWSSRRAKTMFVCRSVLITASVVLTILNAATGLVLPFESVDCLVDQLHQTTAPVNEYLAEASVLRNALLIIGAGLSDVLLLVALCHYWFLGNTLRPALAVVALLMLQLFCQLTFYMKVPDDLAWTYPGFPSLLVPYTVSLGFFFAGYIALLTLICLGCWSLRKKWLLVLAVVALVLESVLAIILRSHYTIDVVFAFIFAHYLWITCERPAEWIDQKLRNWKAPHAKA